MVNTPTIWKARCISSTTPIPATQYDPDIVDIGMRPLRGGVDGRCRWADWNGQRQPDLVGQIFDAKGHRVGSEFQVNWNLFARRRAGCSAGNTAGRRLRDGLRGHRHGGTSIRAETYDVNGTPAKLRRAVTIAVDPASPTRLSTPAIAMRPDGSYLVTYSRERSSVAPPISSARSSTPPARRAANSRSSDSERHYPQSPTWRRFHNGNYVVVYEDAYDATLTDFDPQFSIVDATGADR